VIVSKRAELPPNLPARYRLAAQVAGRHLLWLLVWVVTSAGAQSQLLNDSAAYRNAGASVAPGGGGGGAGGGGSRGLFITPTLSASATLTDNVDLSSTDKQSALILGITPGITLGWQLGR
jgi:hypothetical protein